MAIEHMDNFSMYGTNKALLLNGVYAEATQPFATFGITADPDASGGRCVFFTVSNATTPTLRYVLDAAQEIVGWCGRVWLSELPSDDNRRPNVISFRDASNGQFIGFLIETTGRVTAYGDLAGGSVTTTNPVMTANGWYHWEIKYDTSGNGGLELRIEGLTVIDLDDLGYAGHGATYQISSYFAGTNFDDTTMYLKDYVVWNGDGALNTDFLGSVIVYDLAPDADIDLNWTPNGQATGFAILDNSPPDDGVDFLNATFPPPDAYVCTVGNLPPDVTSVKALMTMVRAAKSDGGDGFLQMGLISDPDGTPATVLGADRPITVAFTYWRDVFETDPKTSAPWLPSAVDEVQMQMDRTA